MTGSGDVTKPVYTYADHEESLINNLPEKNFLTCTRNFSGTRTVSTDVCFTRNFDLGNFKNFSQNYVQSSGRTVGGARVPTTVHPYLTSPQHQVMSNKATGVCDSAGNDSIYDIDIVQLAMQLSGFQPETTIEQVIANSAAAPADLSEQATILADSEKKKSSCSKRTGQRKRAARRRRDASNDAENTVQNAAQTNDKEDWEKDIEIENSVALDVAVACYMEVDNGENSRYSVDYTPVSPPRVADTTDMLPPVLVRQCFGPTSEEAHAGVASNTWSKLTSGLETFSTIVQDTVTDIRELELEKNEAVKRAHDAAVGVEKLRLVRQEQESELGALRLACAQYKLEITRVKEKNSNLEKRLSTYSRLTIPQQEVDSLTRVIEELVVARAAEAVRRVSAQCRLLMAAMKLTAYRNASVRQGCTCYRSARAIMSSRQMHFEEEDVEGLQTARENDAAGRELLENFDGNISNDYLADKALVTAALVGAPHLREVVLQTGAQDVRATTTSKLGSACPKIIEEARRWMKDGAKVPDF